ncbi:MAG: hypothetical protein SXQ77_08580, partial [Halobacteria archaeon]|nr:hypothetical protein [Halobacteria archaeon]
MDNEIHQDKEVESNDRRSALRKLGLVAATAGTIPGQALAQSDSGSSSLMERRMRKIYKRSLELRDRFDWDVGRWRKFIGRRGFDVKFKDATYKVPSVGDDRVTIQKYEENKCTLHMSYIEPSYGAPIYIDFGWEIEFDWS